MPPSPRIVITLNEQMYDEVCKELGLSEPPTFWFKERLAKGQNTTGGSSAKYVYGTYSPMTNTVTIFTAKDEYGYDKLRAVNAELVSTILHELRHAWQRQDGSPYVKCGVVDEENDAEGWAKANYHKWRGLVKVERKTFRRALPG